MEYEECSGPIKIHKKDPIIGIYGEITTPTGIYLSFADLTRNQLVTCFLAHGKVVWWSATEDNISEESVGEPIREFVKREYL
jgi:hypothetical protein